MFPHLNMANMLYGVYYARLPLANGATIVHGNALRMDWEDVVPKEKLSYILGNPPFVGKKEQTTTQKEDMRTVFGDFKGTGSLDYVSAWYRKATSIMVNTQIRAAFVSTNP